MKKIYCISAALALVFATVSCEKRVVETDFTPDETPMVPVTLTGSIPETRVSLDGVTPTWTAGDQLAVFTTDGTLCPAFTADQGGSNTTTFSGSIVWVQMDSSSFRNFSPEVPRVRMAME